MRFWISGILQVLANTPSDNFQQMKLVFVAWLLSGVN